MQYKIGHHTEARRDRQADAAVQPHRGRSRESRPVDERGNEHEGRGWNHGGSGCGRDDSGDAAGRAVKICPRDLGDSKKTRDGPKRSSVLTNRDAEQIVESEIISGTARCFP